MACPCSLRVLVCVGLGALCWLVKFGGSETFTRPLILFTHPIFSRPQLRSNGEKVTHKTKKRMISCDIVQIQVHDDTRICFARPAPPEGERRRRCVGRTAFRSTSTLSAKANGFVWLGGGRRSCVMVIGPQDCHCDLAALPPQGECGRGQACGHDCFLDRREAACRRRVRV